MDFQELKKIMKDDKWSLEVIDKIEEFNKKCPELNRERKRIIERYKIMNYTQILLNVALLMLIIWFNVFLNAKYTFIFVIYIIYLFIFYIYKINHGLSFHLEDNNRKWEKNLLSYYDKKKFCNHISAIPVKIYAYSPVIHQDILSLPDGNFVKVSVEYAKELQSKKYLIANIEVITLIDHSDIGLGCFFPLEDTPKYIYSLQTQRKDGWYLINPDDNRDIISLDSIAVQ